MLMPQLLFKYIFQVHERFVETAYAAFLNGADDDDLKPLIADLEKKLGKDAF